ncbi:MAG: hypothetical protein ACLRWM_02380 [Streptococcus sp.]
MEARAIAKYIRMSPIKVGVVLNLIKGKVLKKLLLFYNILQEKQQ